MRKIFIFFVISLYFCNVQAGGIDECIPCEGKPKSECNINSCLEKRINELIDINNKLREENKGLSEKYKEFNSGIEAYIKVLAESKFMTDKQRESYEKATEYFTSWMKYIIFGFFGFLGALAYVFQIVKNKDFELEKDTLEKTYKLLQTAEDRINNSEKRIEELKKSLEGDLGKQVTIKAKEIVDGINMKDIVSEIIDKEDVIKQGKDQINSIVKGFEENLPDTNNNTNINDIKKDIDDIKKDIDDIKKNI